MRIYEVTNNINGASAMVKAKTPGQALKAISKDSFSVKLASAVDAIEFMQAGGIITDADAILNGEVNYGHDYPEQSDSDTESEQVADNAS